jgi:hypothetical protein
MRPIVFHLADNAMVVGLKGFFGRDNWHHALRCARFDIEPTSEQDFFKVPGRNDQSLWKSAHEYLRPFQRVYERAVVIIDESFDPSPGAQRIRADVKANMLSVGWEEDRFAVVVIEPMLESWLWMENDNVAKAFGVDDYTALRDTLIAEGLWDPGQPKPKATELKRALIRATKMGGKKSGRIAFSNVFEKVSSRALDNCTEPGFRLLRTKLQEWFPQQTGMQAQ